MDDIKELINLMYKEKTTDEAYDAVIKMMHSQIDDTYKKFRNGNTAYIDSVMQDALTFSKKLNKETMPLIYDRLFTQDEIKEYIRFYKTAAGQKLIKSQNEIQKEMIDSVSKYISGIQAKFKAKLEERKADTDTYKTDSVKGKEIKKGSSYASQYRILGDKLDSITRKELKNGIITDTAFMTFCFGDSPERTNTKLTLLIKNGNVKVDSSRKMKTYIFPADEALKNGSWRISFKYAHEVLTEVYLYYVPSLENILNEKNTSVINIKDALQKKYGECSAIDSSKLLEDTEYKFYWIKNNLKVHLYGTQPKPNKPALLLILTYSDTRYDKITIGKE